MLKKTITYKIDDQEITEPHYFNLTKAEIIELEISQDGTLSDIIKTLIDTEDAHKVLAIFKRIVQASYGKRSDDGKQFIKDPVATQNFLTSEAYSEMFVQMLQDPKNANDFFEGLIPKDMVDEIQKDKMQSNSDKPSEPAQDEAVQAKIDEQQEAFKRWQAEQAAKNEQRSAPPSSETPNP